ncbi:branched-chain amino acid ABC transporter permease [Neotabrizicola shimadae]|uniref:Branched-chain amino acid ABC transporter permease n=1 Tax=Neotabrizicola shimadae TaxID=2807096 RepID=A0A8G0ZVG6_9RHOB|nr:branched-chain amino acid ABC transporter permease [Neotabrizicola shimadae]QYZ69592.1 branched-chain amino acid ABC transporter permease [Neotabrizicola shimadae]
MTGLNLTLRALLVAALIALAAAPIWAGNNLTRILSEGLVLCALAILWNLLAGYAGRVSVGQQAFVGIGAYAMLAFSLHTAMPPLLSVPLAAVVGAIISLPIALLVFRLRGHYFAIATWAVAEILRLVVMQIPALGGGSGTSLPGSVLKSISADRGLRADLIYWTVFAVFAATLVGALLLMRSRWGLALRAMRDSELAAESLGIRLTPLRLAVYCGTAGMTAAIGATVLMQKLRISPDAAFSVQDWTAFILFIAVIGGVGTLEGPILGTLVFLLLRETLADYGPVYLILLGSVGVATMLLAPRGLWGWLGPRGLSLLPDKHNP